MFIHCNNSRLCCQFLVSIGYSIEFLYIHDCSRIQKTKLGELIAQRLERWTFYPRDAMLALVIEIATCLSVCLSVCHAPVLCQNEES